MREIQLGDAFHVEMTKQDEFLFWVGDEDGVATTIIGPDKAVELARWLLASCQRPEGADRTKLLTKVVARLREEYLHEKTGTEGDEAYNAAVAHCIGAVKAMIGDDYGESEMRANGDV